LPLRAKKELEVDESELLERVQMHCAKPELSKLAIVLAVIWPWLLLQGVLFQWDWYLRHTLRGEPLSDEDKAHLTRCVINISTPAWAALEPRKRAEWLSKELWEADNVRKWRDAQAKGKLE